MKRGNSTPDEIVTLFAAIPESEVPTPGSFTEVTLSNGMIATIHNPRKGEPHDRRPRSLSYVPVSTDTEWEEVIHAGISRRVNRRIRLEWFTLCDRQGKRVARQRVTGTLDGAVTCQQCRTQLVEDGMIDSIEPPDHEQCEPTGT